jgi:hypothetical protein
MKKLPHLLILILSLSLAACKTTSGTVSDPYYGAWFDLFGNVCGYSPRPGCDYYSNGLKIMVYEDPYYYLWMQDPTAGYGLWYSPSGIIYDSFGYAINADRSWNETSIDVITNAAEAGDRTLKTASEKFASEYGLSTSSALEVARTLNQWATLGKSRSRTEADIADFSEKLFGIKPDRIADAIQASQDNHTLKPLLDLNDEVAAHWGTTPETSKMILLKWYRGELSRF